MAWAGGAGADHAAAAVTEAERAARASVNRAEDARLRVQLERDRLARELEDAAYAEPVVAAECLPAGRVRRLNQLR